MSLNPNAKPFSLNSSAREWTPPGAKAAPPTTAATPPVPPSVIPVATTSPQQQQQQQAPEPEPDKVATAADEVEEKTVSSASGGGGGDGEEDIDENDPLWKVTLKIANGNRAAAVKMLEDPDALMSHPEVIEFMKNQEEGGGGGGAEDSVDSSAANSAEAEKTVEAKQGGSSSSNSEAPVVAKKVAAVESTTIVASSPKSASSSSKASGGGAAAGDEGEEGAADDEVVVDDDPRQHMNLVFIGHVDAGKSTLSGSLLYIMGKVDKRTIERYEREAKERNRESWFLAFIMDTSEEERAKGKTVEVGRAQFETEIKRYTILDAPGHKNYVPNMIQGASQADVGILVISARKGEFETGFEKGGQTREHALLARTLGVQFLVVVINKMDDPTVNWDQTRYEECVSKLKPFLAKQCGYTIKRDVRFLPISGISGDNLLKEVPEAKCPWWKSCYTAGNHNTSTPTLLSTLDALSISGRNPEAPLRVPCLDRYFERGCVVLGKIESGVLRMDDEVVLRPTNKKGKVDAIYIGETKVRSAKPGENVLVKFSNINVDDVQRGYVLCHASSPCPVVVAIKVQLALVDMLDHRPLFTKGYEAVLHVHTIETEVTCSSLQAVIIEGQEKKLPFARNGQMCVAIFTFPQSLSVENYDTLAAMGRFTLRDEGTTIGIGKIIGMKLHEN